MCEAQDDACVLRELERVHEKLDKLLRLLEPYPNVGLVDVLVRIFTGVVCLFLWCLVCVFGLWISGTHWGLT
jgi:hypothetical protein